MWSKNHWLCIGRHKKSDGTSSDLYAGGTYTLDGNHYQESIMYHNRTDWVGNKPKMVLEIKGDSLIQTYVADEKWQINKSKTCC